MTGILREERMLTDDGADRGRRPGQRREVSVSGGMYYNVDGG